MFHIFGGAFGNSTTEERAIRDTVCQVGDTVFRGNRQSVSLTLGRASSVGTFEAPAGEVQIICDYTRERLAAPRHRTIRRDAWPPRPLPRHRG